MIVSKPSSDQSSNQEKKRGEGGGRVRDALGVKIKSGSSKLQFCEERIYSRNIFYAIHIRYNTIHQYLFPLAYMQKKNHLWVSKNTLADSKKMILHWKGTTVLW